MDGIRLAHLLIALTLKVVNIGVHSVGIYIIRCLQNNDRGDVQMIYIVNLSVTELIINVTSFVRNVLKILPFAVFSSPEFKSIVMHSYIVDYTVLKLSLFITLIVITLDRIFLIILGVFYPLYWSTNRAKNVVLGIWISGLTLFVSTTIWYNKEISRIQESTRTADTYINNNTQNYTNPTGNRVSSRNVAGQFFLTANFVTVSLDFMFITIAIITYGVIFHKLKESQRKRYARWRPELKRNSTLWGIFRESRFYSALLLIITFVVFVIPCDLTWAYYSLKRAPKTVGLLTTTSYAISYLSDGLIYIFMNDNVKNLLQRKVRNHRRESAVSINLYLSSRRASISHLGNHVKKGFRKRIANRLRILLEKSSTI